MKLELKNVTKVFTLSHKQRKENKTTDKYLTAVNDLSLDIKPGIIYGLLGPNGAGKTTTLRMIASLIRPKSGEILFNGEDIYKLDSKYRKEVGFLTSELKLDDFFTPDYTFTYMSRLYGIEENEIIENKKKLFKAFGINEFKDVQIKNLSTGMKQKVSLAISLAHSPKIIIFDEPTNGLDIVASKDVENFLLGIKNENRIIVISTHIFSLAEKLCDEVGIIAKGKLIKEVTKEELKKSNTSLEDLFFSIYEGGNE